jgi:uncharacterized protein with PIN domain
MEKMVTIRFYEELNNFLPRNKRKKDICKALDTGETVKKVIEDLGIPHTEVDLVLVNGESVAFDYRLTSGDRISVYPEFESFDVKEVSKVRPVPLRNPRFILDVHLGKLSTFMRMLGFDTLYSNTYVDEDLVKIALSEGRIILTRDRELLKRRAITHGAFVRSKDSRKQLAEVIERFHMKGRIRPFSRCLRCNALLADVERREITGRVPSFVEENYDAFKLCVECGRIYWKGAHWRSMKRIVDRFVS